MTSRRRFQFGHLPGVPREYGTIIVSLATFFALGLSTGALGVTWPSMRASLGAPLAGLGMLIVVLTVSYSASCAATRLLVHRLGFRWSLVTATGSAAAGLVLLARTPAWTDAAWAVALIGLGSGAINAAINAHAGVIGGIRRMGLLHASWALGGAASPLLVIACSHVQGGRAQVGDRFFSIEDWRIAFFLIALAFAVLAIAWCLRPDHRQLQKIRLSQPGRPDLRLMSWMLFVFAYVGLETSIGQWSYSQLAATSRLEAPVVGLGVTAFWLCLMAGRLGLVLGGSWFEPIQRRLTWLDRGVGGALCGVVAWWIMPGSLTTLLVLPVIGLSLSILLPLQYNLVPERVKGPEAARAIFYSAAAGTMGGAVAPAVAGAIMQSAGPGTLAPILVALALLMTWAHRMAKVHDAPSDIAFARSYVRSLQVRSTAAPASSLAESVPTTPYPEATEPDAAVRAKRLGDRP